MTLLLSLDAVQQQGLDPTLQRVDFPAICWPPDQSAGFPAVCLQQTMLMIWLYAGTCSKPTGPRGVGLGWAA